MLFPYFEFYVSVLDNRGVIWGVREGGGYRGINGNGKNQIKTQAMKTIIKNY